MAKNYRLVPTVLDGAWDAFVGTSPDASVFIAANYLAHTGCRLGLYRCYNVDEPRAVVAVVESPDGTSATLDDLVIYSGICFGTPTSGQSRAQRISERHEIASFIVGALVDRYETIEFALAPSIDDVRPFLWHNYGQDAGRFSVDVRYTSYLSIADFAGAERLEDIEAYRQATGARRQEIRYARRDGVVTEEFHNVAIFIDFYRRTMERQGETVALSALDRMATLVDALLGNGLARMFSSRTVDGRLGSVAVYAFDTFRAYYLFGANDPALRNTHTGTAILWDSFVTLAAKGVAEVDLEGVNSPHRGWFKLSFGGNLRPYYQVALKHQRHSSANASR
ncbi:MAG: GNAT family N-acetyltransferase [Methylovulum sp.]|nr:GNAT family N-acetyltransferase [Methylovulum sp.]